MLKKRSRSFLLIILLALISTVAAKNAWAAGLAAPFKILEVWPITADDRWDNVILDAKAHLLYISRATRVQVVDTKMGKLAGEIVGFKHTHGVTLDATGKFGYISDGDANQVVVFDRVSRKIVAKIDAPTGPDFIIFEPKTEYVLAFNHTSFDATVIDTKTFKIVATIPLPGEPEGAKVDGTGKVFLNIETAHALVRIDAQQLKVTATWPLAPCTRPTGLGFDFDRKRLFSVCGNQKMVVVDSDNGKVVSVASIGDKSDGVAYDAKDALVFTSNGDGTLSVFSQQSPDSYELVQTLATHLGARTVAIDPVANTLYLVAADIGPTPSPTTEIPKPKAPVLPGTFVILKVGR